MIIKPSTILVFEDLKLFLFIKKFYAFLYIVVIQTVA